MNRDALWEVHRFIDVNQATGLPPAYCESVLRSLKEAIEMDDPKEELERRIQIKIKSIQASRTETKLELEKLSRELRLTEERLSNVRGVPRLP